MAASRIHHLNCGTMCPFGARLLNGRGGLLEPGLLICHVLLVETPRDGLVVVDTGYGTADVADPTRLPLPFRLVARPALDRRQTAFEQIQQLGFDPRDVKHVVITHLDLDHAGGLADFPWARVHLHATEHRAAMRRATFPERVRYIPAQWAHQPLWQTYDDLGEEWFGLRAIRRLEGLDDDVALVPLFGHSRGHSGVAVNDGERWLLHAGDAYFFRGQIERPPSCPPGLAAFEAAVQFDRRGRLENASRLRTLRAEHAGEVTIFSAHDPVELERMQQRQPATHRYAERPAGE